jgi:hypothetical protein
MAVLIFTLVALKVAKGCMVVLKVAKGLEADERDLVRPEVRRQRQQLRRAWPRAVQVGLYRLSLSSTAQPLYTRFPIIFGSCFSEVTIGYNPTLGAGEEGVGRRKAVQSRKAG